MMQHPPEHRSFDLVAIPLRRPDVATFLRDWKVPARGARVAVVEQRPTPVARDRWLADLSQPGGDSGTVVARLLATDDPMTHVGVTSTDRLVPRHFLDDDPGWLERNLGGWSPLWFGPMAVMDDAVDGVDPLLAVSEPIVAYGPSVPGVGVDPEVVATRLETELPGGAARVTAAAAAMRRLRQESVDPVADLVGAVRGTGDLAHDLDPLLAYDELIEQLMRLEVQRRTAVGEDRPDAAGAMAAHQERIAEEWGIRLLLKGEYVMGRHRRSTVLLAEGLGVVVKQPAPEPEHQIDLGIRSHDGLEENWPRPIGNGAMVTARGAIGKVVESGAVARLDRAFGREVQFSTSLGLSVEPFESGPTLAGLAVARPQEFTSDRYDEILVHQLACEELGVDNPDWHAANFMVTDAGLVHVDWGAAQPIPPDQDTPAARRARLDQVRELAWSFQDEDLARTTVALHTRATEDPAHVERLRDRARAIVGTA